MAKFLANLFLLVLGVSAIYFHYTIGWGMKPVSWPAIIGWGFFVPVVILALREGLNGKL